MTSTHTADLCYTEATVNHVISHINNIDLDTTQAKVRYHVVELGAGTGNMTSLIHPRLPQCRYLATEPRSDFLSVLTSQQPEVKTSLNSAANIPVEDHSVGCVVCAQSFHWFHGGKNLKEIHRVLTPGGKLIIVMNLKDFRHGWMRGVVYAQRERVFARAGGSMAALLGSGEWRAELTSSPLFALDSHVTLPGVEFRGEMEEILNNLTAVSAYGRLSRKEFDRCKDELRQMLTSWPGVDVFDISIPYTSEIYVYVAK